MKITFKADKDSGKVGYLAFNSNYNPHGITVVCIIYSFDKKIMKFLYKIAVPMFRYPYLSNVKQTQNTLAHRLLFTDTKITFLNVNF